MSSVFDNYRYQLVYPIQSTTIQIAKNLASGAKKCYNELKTNHIQNPLFVIHSLDTNELYHYEIPKYKKNMISNDMTTMGGGAICESNNMDQEKNSNIEKNIQDIIKRLELLENKIDTIQ